MYKKKLIFLLFVLLGIFLLSGCYDRATINTYSDPSFSKNTITRLAIFPMKNVNLTAGESRAINRGIAKGIHQINPNIEIMSTVEIIQILNKQGLTSEWSAFLEDYASTGVPNTETLFKIGDVLGVDGLMQGEIVNVYQENSHYGVNQKAPSVKLGVARVTVRYSTFGTDSGKLLWEATSDGINKTGITFSDDPSLIEAVMLAQQKIIENLPF
ncbi:hypothetical protein GM661_14740 [Iocasia frigidifontis]|uniref:Lipoprotein n=1 Tax=Iocasia fonsfrigidae TaxID=2682810 RepID=A0A8A7KBA2_9FIRM|nr:hypothetical protein [Iocasia fonsfrigidae]QTL99123.1 hypothetical protein GM661_14740 [Iocasia fonsfrigidae]